MFSGRRRRAFYSWIYWPDIDGFKLLSHWPKKFERRVEEVKEKLLFHRRTKKFGNFEILPLSNEWLIRSWKWCNRAWFKIDLKSSWLKRMEKLILDQMRSFWINELEKFFRSNKKQAVSLYLPNTNVASQFSVEMEE